MAELKIVIVVSHPIQHFSPMYAKLAKCPEWDLHVIFACPFGVRPSFDRDFEKYISWSNLKLDQFSHEFLVEQPEHEPAKWDLSAPNLEARLQYHEPKVVIVYGYHQKLQRRAAKWAKQNQKMVLMISDAERRSSRPFLTLAIKRIMIPKLIRNINAFLTVGDANEAYYDYYGDGHAFFFRAPFPIDIDLYEQSWTHRTELRRQCRTRLGIPEQNLVLSMVGKLIPRKRQQDLIQALMHVNLPANNMTLLLIGTGSTEMTLRLQTSTVTEQDIRFVGFVDPEQLPEYYAASDIYVHTSSHDPHPLAISEAIYMGCPAIASRAIGSWGPTDDVQIGRNGYVYSTGDVFELATLLSRLGVDETLREKFGQSSHMIAVEHQSLAHGIGLKRALIGLGCLQIHGENDVESR